MSVLLYNSETWCTYRRQENRLNAFNFRCLRSILGVSWRDHVPNSTILHVIGSYDLTTIIRQRRLRWLGNVWKMVACPISSTASSITRLVELADPNCVTKTSSSVTWRASTSLHSHGKTCCRSQQMACLSEL